MSIKPFFRTNGVEDADLVKIGIVGAIRDFKGFLRRLSRITRKSCGVKHKGTSNSL